MKDDRNGVLSDMLEVFKCAFHPIFMNHSRSRVEEYRQVLHQQFPQLLASNIQYSSFCPVSLKAADVTPPVFHESWGRSEFAKSTCPSLSQHSGSDEQQSKRGENYREETTATLIEPYSEALNGSLKGCCQTPLSNLNYIRERPRGVPFVVDTSSPVSRSDSNSDCPHHFRHPEKPPRRSERDTGFDIGDSPTTENSGRRVFQAHCAEPFVSSRNSSTNSPQSPEYPRLDEDVSSSHPPLFCESSNFHESWCGGS
eukprot:GHVN01003678.1.p2 GENE.GHVN01003678.1~~GHVN01003678.1.p2  ORF type:complete len:255 (-),score=27.10 GHVN01003678.1:1625-2389(-)